MVVFYTLLLAYQSSTAGLLAIGWSGLFSFPLQLVHERLLLKQIEPPGRKHELKLSETLSQFLNQA